MDSLDNPLAEARAEILVPSVGIREDMPFFTKRLGFRLDQKASRKIPELAELLLQVPPAGEASGRKWAPRASGRGRSCRRWRARRGTRRSTSSARSAAAGASSRGSSASPATSAARSTSTTASSPSLPASAPTPTSGGAASGSWASRRSNSPSYRPYCRRAAEQMGKCRDPGGIQRHRMGRRCPGAAGRHRAVLETIVDELPDGA